eukprot:5206244-Amphidinium_carterae.1
MLSAFARYHPHRHPCQDLAPRVPDHSPHRALMAGIPMLKIHPKALKTHTIDSPTHPLPKPPKYNGSEFGNIDDSL